MRDPTTLLTASAVRQDRAARGVLEGALPLVVALVWVVVTLAAAALARQATAEQDFITRQTTTLNVAIVGLALTVLSFAASCVLVLRRVSAAQRLGRTRYTTAALWTLAAVALIVVLPVILAGGVPLHP